MAIQFVLPYGKIGGVYDFSCRLQKYIGVDAVRLVHLTKENETSWSVRHGDVVVLQMSGYGFDKRGAPIWLLKAIEKRRKLIKIFGVYFHELYAFGPPWSSSFWLSPVQRYISRRLVQLSDFWMTNREGSAVWLRQYAADKLHAVLPVFSTIGEPSSIFQGRRPSVVVFGSPGLRQATYKVAGDNFFTWSRQASLTIHDIGAPIPDTLLADALCENGVVMHGRTEDRKISDLLSSVLFGLLAYPIEYVAKSSVFAAYCAHGVCPILFSKKYLQTDGLMAGTHYLPGVPEAKVAGQAEYIAGEVYEWYQPHSLCNHVAFLESVIL